MAREKTFVINSLASYIDEIVKLRDPYVYIDTAKKYFSINGSTPNVKDAGKYAERYRDYINKHEHLFAKSLAEKDKYNRPQGKFYFRGQNNSQYVLNPATYRGQNLPRESYYYHEIMVSCPDYFKDTSHVEKLIIMQHYGTPTRLLDVTTNPLVALYFACSGWKNEFSNSESASGKVFVFFTNYSDVLYPDSDRALMLSCIPKFSYEEQMEMWTVAVESLIDDKFKRNNKHVYANKLIESHYHEITTERPAFKREMKPFDLLWPSFVQPNKGIQRILKQDGAFILSGLCENEDEAAYKLAFLSGIEFTITNQEEILKQLDFIGINQASLFPELDMVGDYLKNV